MTKQSLTVVVPRDPSTGDVDPSAPALFYSAEGYFLGSRKLGIHEIQLMGGRQTAKLAVTPPLGDIAHYATAAA